MECMLPCRWISCSFKPQSPCQMCNTCMNCKWWKEWAPKLLLCVAGWVLLAEGPMRWTRYQLYTCAHECTQGKAHTPRTLLPVPCLLNELKCGVEGGGDVGCLNIRQLPWQPPVSGWFMFTNPVLCRPSHKSRKGQGEAGDRQCGVARNVGCRAADML